MEESRQASKAPRRRSPPRNSRPPEAGRRSVPAPRPRSGATTSPPPGQGCAETALPGPGSVAASPWPPSADIGGDRQAASPGDGRLNASSGHSFRRPGDASGRGHQPGSPRRTLQPGLPGRPAVAAHCRRHARPGSAGPGRPWPRGEKLRCPRGSAPPQRAARPGLSR